MLNRFSKKFEKLSLAPNGLGVLPQPLKNWWRKPPELSPRMRSALVRLTSPAIFAVAVPIALLDLFVTVYQYICFPIYGIRIVPRWHFVVLDRHELPYLTFVERLNCTYCGYANGVIAYVREIASRTEQRWCPIKHGKVARGRHSRYRDFAAYGDEKAAKDWRDGIN